MLRAFLLVLSTDVTEATQVKKKLYEADTQVRFSRFDLSEINYF